MKKEKTIYFIAILSLLLIILAKNETKSQDFTVSDIKGTVLVQKGISEEFEPVSTGDILHSSDLLVTDKNSLIQLVNESRRFILKSNSALGLNYIKEISLNDLLLALAMEEVRSIPKGDGKVSKSTAVYGSKETNSVPESFAASSLGIKRINGARQLAESGYKEASVIAAKETFRKYPSTRQVFKDRIYFADLLRDLGLNREALTEYNDIAGMKIKPEETVLLNARIEEVGLAIANEK